MSFLEIYPKDISTSKLDIGTRVKNWKQPQCPSIRNWLKKSCHSLTGAYQWVGEERTTPAPRPHITCSSVTSGPDRPRGGGGKASTSIEVSTFVSNTGLDMLIPESNWRRVFWCVCVFFFNSLKMTEKYIDHQEISPKKQRRNRS